MRTAEWVKAWATGEAVAGLPLPQGRSVAWRSVCAEARPVLFAARWLAAPRKTLIVVSSYDKALQWQAKLQLCGVPGERIRQLPSGTAGLFADAPPEHVALSERLGALQALVGEGDVIVIAPASAALERTLPRESLLDAHLELAPGSEVDPEKLLRRLERLGFERAEPVRLPGQFSRRGGIVDVWPAGREAPLRIELFGDEIESIRPFDPNTQRSVGTNAVLDVAPSRETLFTGDPTALASLVLDSLEREAAALDEEAANRLRDLVSGDADALGAGVYFDRVDLYRPLLHPESGCALDLLPDGGLVVLDEPLELETIAQRAADELEEALQARQRRGEILETPVADLVAPLDRLGACPDTLALTALDSLPRWIKPASGTDLGAASLEPYRGRAEQLALTLRNYRRDNLALVFTTDQPHRATAVLEGAEIHPNAEDETQRLVSGNLGAGFVWPDAKIALVTDGELFGVARLKLPQKRFMEGVPLATVLDLKPGDYVVHINFGIGVFRGLTKRVVDGVEKEFLYVEYQAPDKLFVPADQLDRIQKYLNPGDETPKLNKLTGGEWQRTLGKAKEEAKAFARDLVALYAQRQAVQRRPYGPDTPFQEEMEATFPWMETPGQMSAIREVKADMETGYPMDRLVCGDVGFGKTEVAIRAAFKAVQAGRQVAVLCPTTILAEQHYRNFSERLGGFGTEIGLVNRYTTPKEKKEIYTGLKNGKVEMVVGTHALLGQGIQFNDLGLVVIDEEQKFGVKQKEQLKSLRTEVDVLTLSATPIPRTLSMALMDIRQMSQINDPPPGRLPVRTYVRSYAGEVVREAILREMARGGQVFYVYNRVESIYHVEEKLRKLVPNARIGVAHGQMKDTEIEPIMVGFVKGEIDVLLSTTIVENGIDISNANTLIVEQADRLGLSQLYQLRGRVGRSDRQAYAYFLYSGMMDLSFVGQVATTEERKAELKKKYKTVTEGAMARLQALQEFSNLGSGYSLAFRDLQIRGAGELLGAKQSGTMLNVGYELYTQLIQEAVAQLKSGVDGKPVSGELAKDPLSSLAPLPSLDVSVPAYLPEAYITDSGQRLYYYQQLMAARDEISLAAVEAAIEDRYGKPPAEVRAAFRVVELRMRADRLQFEKVTAKGGRVAVVFRYRDGVSPRVFSVLGKRLKDGYLTKEAYILPHSGDPLDAIERFMDAWETSREQVESALASLKG